MAMLMLIRHGTRYDQQMYGGGWNFLPSGHELGTRTVGVVGLGNIGRAVVKRLVGGFDCSVLGTDMWEKAPPWFGDLGRWRAARARAPPLFRPAVDRPVPGSCRRRARSRTP
jgi:phosphoglycerate dehydrogenase-like enzyme